MEKALESKSIESPPREVGVLATARWCATCADHTAHERIRDVWCWLREPRFACVRCTGRLEQAAHARRRAWLDGRTIIDPL